MASNDTGVRTTTLSDVARLAGVSLATASKAMNGRTDVAPATRRRVLEAAEDLAFTPNAMARGLLAGRTGTVGLLTSDLDGRFMLPILMGAEDAFGAGQVNVFLCDARGDAIREQHHLRALLSRRVDGIIVVGRQTDPRPSLGQDIPVPVVYAYAPSDDDRDLSLTRTIAQAVASPSSTSSRAGGPVSPTSRGPDLRRRTRTARRRPLSARRRRARIRRRAALGRLVRALGTGCRGHPSRAPP